MARVPTVEVMKMRGENRLDQFRVNCDNAGCGQSEQADCLAILYISGLKNSLKKIKSLYLVQQFAFGELGIGIIDKITTQSIGVKGH